MHPTDDVDTNSHLPATVPLTSVNSLYVLGALVYLSQAADWGPHPRWCSSSWSHHLQIPQTHPFGPLWSTGNKEKQTHIKLANKDQFRNKRFPILLQNWHKHGLRLAPPHPPWSDMMRCQGFNESGWHSSPEQLSQWSYTSFRTWL